ncbi:helix-turn-helix domain-containing protein [Syntrophomonas erecta]
MREESSNYNNNGQGRFPPWSRIQALPEMVREAGVDYDQFIECLKNGLSSEEMAWKFTVSQQTIERLKEHFFRYGISSVEGGD